MKMLELYEDMKDALSSFGLKFHDMKEVDVAVEDGKVVFSYSEGKHDMTFAVKVSEPNVVVDDKTAGLDPDRDKLLIISDSKTKSKLPEGYGGCGNCTFAARMPFESPCEGCNGTNNWELRPGS